jgi:hypothetical protein
MRRPKPLPTSRNEWRGCKEMYLKDLNILEKKFKEMVVIHIPFRGCVKTIIENDKTIKF